MKLIGDCKIELFYTLFIVILSSCAKELIYEESNDDAFDDIVYSQEDQNLYYVQETAGCLAEYVESHYLKNRLKSLTIRGPINSTDLLCIREMAGSDIFGKETRGILDSLDISQCRFVEGGNAYYIERSTDGYSTKEYFTKSNCIAAFAFNNCSKLHYIILPPSIESIEQSAFEGCSHLLSIKLPNSLKIIEKRAFMDCPLLCPDFVVSEGLVIPDGIIEIPDSMFLGCTIMSKIVLPSTIKRIGASAFNGCRDATIIYDGNSPESFGEYAFAGCENFTGIKIPKTMKSIPQYSFYGCTSMKDNLIPEGIESIESHAFASSGITGTLVLPHSLNHIGTCAFDAINISELIVNSNISCDKQSSYWNGSDFGHCKRLKRVVVNDPVHFFELRFVHCDSLSEIMLPHSLKRFGTSHNELYSNLEYGYNLYKCPLLKHISLPEGLDSIGVAAFAYTDISKVVIPNSVTYIGNYAYEQCKKLNEIQMPESLKEIGLAAFENCTDMEQIELRGSIKSIGNVTFSGCKALKKVQLPTTIETMGFGVFYNCQSLSGIELPSSLKSIDYSSFAGCTSLQSVVLPSSLETIGNALFKGCSSLNYVENKSFIPQKVSVSVFEGVDLLNSTLKVPSGKSELYRQSSIWKDFGKVIEM